MLLGVDVGGTFTDAVLVDDEGATFTAKAPSTPGDQQLGVMEVVELVLRRAGAHAEQVERFAHGMTVATNALLQISETHPPAGAHPPARTALVVTEGFTDIVELGRQARVSLYRLCEASPTPLAPPDLRFGAPERMGPDGPLRALDEDACDALLERLEAANPQAVAVALLHSYAHPQHERRLGELIAGRLPNAHLSLSHELVGTFREYERAATTEIDAALSPLVGSYLEKLGNLAEARGLPTVQVMQSSGGLTEARLACSHAALTVLSGPAGGVGGALLSSVAAGERNVLCFDMGGTSCDVCLIESSRVGETAHRTVAGRPLALPALDIHTVGAGGGSIAWRDAGGALRVGPQSAGAVPGPACYGLGGTAPTVTDANLLLGRLLAGEPLAGGVQLDREAAERAVGELARELDLEPLACAEGIVKVAESEMLRALTVMTVERGVDPRDFALMPFGGAGPLHAVAMAQELGIRRVLCPRACGVLCALGLAAAPPRRDVSSTVMLSGDAFARATLTRELTRLIELASDRLGMPPVRVGVRYELRYRGQSFELTVNDELSPGDPGLDMSHLVDPARLERAFETAHEQRYGYRDARGVVELVNVRVSAIGPQPSLRLKGTGGPGLEGSGLEGPGPASPGRVGATSKRTPVVFDGTHVEAELWRGELPVGAHITGPALCALPESTLLVPPGWSGWVDEHGTVVLRC